MSLEREKSMVTNAEIGGVFLLGVGIGMAIVIVLWKLSEGK